MADNSDGLGAVEAKLAHPPQERLRRLDRLLPRL
jgi:hypothetical protein